METRTALLHDPAFLEHRPPGGEHPERPARLTAVHDRLERDGILARLEHVAPQPISEEELAAVHTAQHVQHVRRRALAAEDGAYLDPDTYVVRASYRAALLAAGAVAGGVDWVLDGEAGEARRAFALVRPPGHHATPGRAMGFCLFNSIAVAAAHARRRGLRRVCILDWDVHHGNGTQDAFFDTFEVLYLSLHQWPLFPGSGRMNEAGEGGGLGATINVPLPAGTGDAGYRLVFEQVVAPTLRRYQPELILVSAGYDAHAADPLAGMQVSTACFRWMAQMTASLADELCDGRVVAALEGGYDLEALPACVLETLRAFEGEAGGGGRGEGEAERETADAAAQPPGGTLDSPRQPRKPTWRQ